MILALLAAAAAALTPGGAPSPEIHAHRGGSVRAGAPAFGEETMPAFRHAHETEAAVLELDVKLTSDRMPVVIHDDTLDRTTTCTGPVSSVTAAQFGACPVDVLGSGNAMAPAPQPIPSVTLAEVLAYARDAGARINLEIKNLPNDNDFDPTSAYATTVVDAIEASGFRQERLIVQSFWPPNLDVAATRLPRAELSLLTLQPTPGDASFAASRGYDWLSPSGVPSADYVTSAHDAQLRVAPYTLNTAPEIRAAAANGADAIITDDPVTARRALAQPKPAPPGAGQPAPAEPGPGARGKVRLRILSSRLGRVRTRGAIRVRVTTDRALSALDLSVRRGRRLVGQRTVRRLGRGSTTVRIKLDRRRLGARAARLVVTAVGGRAPASARVRLR